MMQKKTLVWFENNHMKANPSKFQGFAIMNQNDNENISLSLSGVDLPITEYRCIQKSLASRVKICKKGNPLNFYST